MRYKSNYLAIMRGRLRKLIQMIHNITLSSQISPRPYSHATYHQENVVRVSRDVNQSKLSGRVDSGCRLLPSCSTANTLHLQSEEGDTAKPWHRIHHTLHYIYDTKRK